MNKSKEKTVKEKRSCKAVTGKSQGNKACKRQNRRKRKKGENRKTSNRPDMQVKTEKLEKRKRKSKPFSTKMKNWKKKNSEKQ